MQPSAQMEIQDTRIEAFRVWAAAGFHQDEEPTRSPFEYDSAQGNSYEYYEKNAAIRAEWRSQLLELNPEDFSSSVLDLFNKAAQLSDRDFRRVAESLQDEFLSVFPWKKSRKVFAEMIGQTTAIDKVPDHWWISPMDAPGNRIMSLTSGVPATRRMINAFMGQSLGKSPLERNREIMVLLGSDPQAWPMLCAHVRALPKERVSSQAGWWVEAIRQFEGDDENGAKRARALYKETRHEVKMALNGGEGSVSKLIALYTGNIQVEFPIEIDDREFEKAPWLSAGSVALTTTQPMSLANLTLSAGTAEDVRSLAACGLDWDKVKIGMRAIPANPYSKVAGPVMKDVGPVEAAFALDNPNALDIWQAIEQLSHPSAETTRSLDRPQRILLAATKWQGGRSRRVMSVNGGIAEMITGDTQAEQAKAARLVTCLIPSSPSLWVSSRGHVASVFLAAVRSKNLAIAARAWEITGGSVGTEKDRAGNAFHALMEMPATEDAQKLFTCLLDSGLPLTATNAMNETPGNILARQPSDVRASWSAVAKKLGVGLASKSIRSTRSPEKTAWLTRHDRMDPADVVVPPTTDLAAVERRRRAEELAERAAERRAEKEHTPHSGPSQTTVSLSRRPRRP